MNEAAMLLSVRYQAAQPYTWETVEAFADRLEETLRTSQVAAKVSGSFSRGEIVVVMQVDGDGRAQIALIDEAVCAVAGQLRLCELRFASVEPDAPVTPWIEPGSMVAELK
jgi:hypothetical protein